MLASYELSGTTFSPHEDGLGVLLCFHAIKRALRLYLPYVSPGGRGGLEWWLRPERVRLPHLSTDSEPGVRAVSSLWRDAGYTLYGHKLRARDDASQSVVRKLAKCDENPLPMKGRIRTSQHPTGQHAK